MNNIVFYILLIVSALVTAFSQILLKVSANKKYKNFISEYFNPFVIISYICFGVILILNVLIYTRIDYRFGVVINSMSIVLIMILSTLILKEHLTRKRIIGNILIISGIICFTLL